ncbi:MAG: hypothetical protein FWG66_13120, partial [Spirochaetes bacterium]|nr:hypothetical protein [Spirochaetota bacterium]
PPHSFSLKQSNNFYTSNNIRKNALQERLYTRSAFFSRREWALKKRGKSLIHSKLCAIKYEIYEGRGMNAAGIHANCYGTLIKFWRFYEFQRMIIYFVAKVEE